MGFSPFATVGDYPGMLNKIATFVFLMVLLGTWFLRLHISSLDTALAPLTSALTKNDPFVLG